MDRFKKHILLFEMSHAEAMKILGMSASDNLKKAYQKAAMAAHPDRGGKTSDMQKVNAAYDYLKKGSIGSTSGLSDKDRMAAYKERKANEKADNEKKVKIIKSIFDKHLDTNVFKKYFEKYTEKPLKVSVTDKSPGYFSRTIEWYTEDRETVFYLNIHTSFNDVDFVHSLGSGEDGVSFNFYSDNYLYHGKRKQKMKAQTWSWKGSNIDIKDPKKLFPALTLKKVFTGKKDRKFAKRDFIEGISRELKGSWDGEWARIPLNKDNGKQGKRDPEYLYLTLYRTTFMRKGMWNFNGIYGGMGTKVQRLEFASIPETEASFKVVVEMVKEMRKKKTPLDMLKIQKLAIPALKKSYEE